MNRLLTLVLLVFLLPLQSGCNEPQPVHIGFIGELTTRAAGLATSGRDGFLLAVEEINQQGGINGQKVEILVEDVHMHKETALNAVRKLAEKQVSVIIGPMTSQTAVAVLPEINRLQIPLISPTVSTNQLNGFDDYFFRVYYTNAQAAQLLAGELANPDQPVHVAAIYDLGNRAYTEDWVQYFQDVLERDGASKVTRIPFDLRTDTLFLDLATRAAAADPDCVLILANAIDTAMLCQQLTKINAGLPRYATGWSYSDDLIQFGGKSVEGLTIIQSANLKDPTPAVQKFVASYRARFHAEPNFPAMHAYDATRMALGVMQKNIEPQAIREQLLNLVGYEGVQSDLSFDRFGDLKHPRLHLARISNNQFIHID